VLQGDIRRLWELGEFETVDFHLAPEGDGYALTIEGHVKSWGPNFLRFGLSLFSDLEGSSRCKLLGAMTMTRLNRLGAELKASAQVGDVPLGFVELYQPVSTSRVPFVAAGAAGSQVKTQIAVAGESIQYRFSQQRVWADAGLSLGRYGEVRAGLRYDTTVGRATRDAGHYPRYNGTDAGPHFALVIDQLDSPNFPRHGVLGVVEAYQARSELGADDEYSRCDLQLVAAASHGRNTLLLQMHGTSALGGTLPPDEYLQLGGLLNLSGLPAGEVSGSYGGVAALLYLYRIGKLPIFGEGIYAGASIEAGNAWEHAGDVSLSDLRHAYALLFGADTLLGPVYLGYAFSTGGKDSFYLMVGRGF
jgi:NTE family protein